MNRLSRLIIATSLFLVVTISLLFITFTKNANLSSISNGITTVVSPIQTLLSKPVLYFSEKKEILTDLFHTYEENQELKQSLFELKEMIADNDTLKKENASLREGLGIVDRHTDKNFIPGFVIVRTPDAWTQQVKIDLGEDDGMTRGMLVLANGGLVGSITSVDSNSSTVKLLSNSDEFTKIPIKIVVDSTDIYGILSGYDTDSNSFIVNQLNSIADIPVGANVVTSDLAGATPANIHIGKVSAVKSSTNDFNRELFVEPTTDFSNLYSVLVVGN